MQAYATSEPPARTELRAVPDTTLPAEKPATRPPSSALLDELLGQLADLVADRLMERTAAKAPGMDAWLDTRRAAEYLGVHRDTIRRLAAESAIPAEQAAAGCKLFFRRRDLDRWRRAESSMWAGSAAATRSTR